MRRLRAADVELGDARERDPDHAHLAVLHPRLRRDGLDDVVAVGGGRQVEQVEDAARAARSAHVHAHGRVAERARDQRGRLRIVGIRHRVARVLDQRRELAARERASERRADHGRQQRPVARPDVVEALVQGLLRIEALIGTILERQHRHRDRIAARVVADDVAASRVELAEDQAAEAIGRAACHLVATMVREHEQGARDGAGHRDQPDSSLRLDGRRAGGDGRESHRSQQQEGEPRPRVPHREGFTGSVNGLSTWKCRTGLRGC